VPETTQGNYDGGAQPEWANDPSCPWIPRILRLKRPICGGGCVGVLFSESPPLKRKDSGQPPFFERPGNGSLLWRAVCGWGLILVVLDAGTWFAKPGRIG